MNKVRSKAVGRQRGAMIYGTSSGSVHLTKQWCANTSDRIIIGRIKTTLNRSFMDHDHKATVSLTRKTSAFASIHSSIVRSYSTAEKSKLKSIDDFIRGKPIRRSPWQSRHMFRRAQPLGSKELNRLLNYIKT